MNSIKSKRLLILLLDILLGILIGCYTSNTFPENAGWVVGLFVILLVLRLGVDWFSITDEEKWYADFIQTKMNEMQRDESLQRIIHKQIESAVQNGDIDRYKILDKLKKDL